MRSRATVGSTCKRRRRDSCAAVVLNSRLSITRSPRQIRNAVRARSVFPSVDSFHRNLSGSSLSGGGAEEDADVAAPSVRSNGSHKHQPQLSSYLDPDDGEAVSPSGDTRRGTRSSRPASRGIAASGSLRLGRGGQWLLRIEEALEVQSSCTDTNSKLQRRVRKHAFECTMQQFVSVHLLMNVSQSRFAPAANAVSMQGDGRSDGRPCRRPRGRGSAGAHPPPRRSASGGCTPPYGAPAPVSSCPCARR